MATGSELSELRIGLWSTNASGAYWIDDVVLE
jgi:hypothetical protein